MNKILLAIIMAFSVACAAQQNTQPAKTQETTQAAMQHPAAKPAPAITYIRAGKLFDSTSDALRENVVIVVEGERIKLVEPAANVQIPAGAKIIDLSKSTALPGLIDCHTHLGARADRYNPINAFKETPYTQAFAAERNARTTLMAGFTTVRDVGSGHSWRWTCTTALTRATLSARELWPAARESRSPADTAI